MAEDAVELVLEGFDKVLDKHFDTAWDKGADLKNRASEKRRSWKSNRDVKRSSTGTSFDKQKRQSSGRSGSGSGSGSRDDRTHRRSSGGDSRDDRDRYRDRYRGSGGRDDGGELSKHSSRQSRDSGVAPVSSSRPNSGGGSSSSNKRHRSSMDSHDQQRPRRQGERDRDRDRNRDRDKNMDRDRDREFRRYDSGSSRGYGRSPVDVASPPRKPSPPPRGGFR